MKYLLYIICFVYAVSTFAQHHPTINIGDKDELRLTQLEVKVEITGNFVSTTYDMTFFNGLDRTLEGELSFPLGEGQSVSNFAMDIDGNLREAVIVEKELARVAYESTIRQRIDPALLEKTEGNNYKARVYPILPNSAKHIRITHEQGLNSINGILRYVLPLNFTQNLAKFSLEINVANADVQCQIVGNPYKNLGFKRIEGKNQAHVLMKNHCPSTPVVIEIPTSQLSGQVLSYRDYFYAYQGLKPATRLKEKPKKVTILWDASYSLKHRKLKEELKLLKSYVSYLGSVDVQFVKFNNRIQQHQLLTLNTDNFKHLEKLISAVKYDGATSMTLFDGLKIIGDEILLFTDGLANLGGFSVASKSSVYTINSTISAAHTSLKRIATDSGGSYINLMRRSADDALILLKQETYQFLGVKSNEAVREIYPRTPTNVTNDFTITGKFSKETSLELLFGYRGKVTKTIPIIIKKRPSSSLVKRLWAKKKLADLNQNKEQQREIIVEFAKQHHLLCDYTSMLILDRLEDYLRYRIEPPLELKADYKQRLSDHEKEKAQRNKEIQARKAWLMNDYQDLYQWYDVNYPIAEVEATKSTELNSSSSPELTINSVEEIQHHEVSNATTGDSNRSTFSNSFADLDQAKQIVSGTVVDENGEVLPSVNVWVDGTQNGTVTDFDGRFAINANTGDKLHFSFIGFGSKEIVIGSENIINVALNADQNLLEEVVVVGYGARVKRSITGAPTRVVSESLAGQVSGVMLEGQGGDNGTVLPQGIVATGVNEVLYIVNGVPYDHNPLGELESTEIQSIHVLKPAQATQLYGEKAANGMMIITTISGLETNLAEIEALNARIENEIALKSWNPNTPYLRILEQEKTVELAYAKYLDIRKKYGNSPSFFLDVSDFFKHNGNVELAITVLSNLIEIDLANHELLKALAYKLSYFKAFDLAVVVNQKILEIRPEDPQSYRDLALAYEEAGEIRKSYDLLVKFYKGALLSKDMEERYYGIEQIAFVELSRLVARNKNKLNLSKKQLAQFKELPVDVRVVIDWNHNDTDIDLWVIDPNGEKAYFSNYLTKIGGRMSNDLTEGYGPEEFMLKNAIQGEYTVMVDYFADNVQKISGPTILKVNLFTNYGKSNEQKKVVIVRLDEEEDQLEVAKLYFGE